MRYISVCSGIEAASQAWAPLGWRAVAFSEIDPFACELLKQHYPDVPNFGDMTKFEEWPDANIDVLVGGTPCQSFSVAGLREGLDDPRGQLMLAFGAIAAKYRPQWLVWENVFGVLSSNKGRDFASFLGLITGQQVEVPKNGWENSGIVSGIEDAYGAAYRVLDAQYFGVPQRRRRVFVVGYLGDWRPPAAVLFERESMSGNPPPSRKAREDIAGTITSGIGERGADDPERGTLIAHALLAKGNSSHDATLENYIPFDTTQITNKDNRSNPQAGDPCHPLSADAHPPAIAFDCKASGQNGFGVGSIAPTLRAMGHKDTHSNGGGQIAVAFQTRIARNGRGQPSEIVPALNGADAGETSDMRPCVITEQAVRRLTPMECERLQGVADNFTRISYRGGYAKDGPRYKALGNSMAVPNVQWLGRRIDFITKILEAAA